MVVDAGSDEDGSSVELARGGCEEEEEAGGGDETEQGEASKARWRVGEVAASTSADGRDGWICANESVSRWGEGDEWTISEDTRTLLSRWATAVDSRTDDAFVAVLLVDASAAPAGGISPAIRSGESDG